MKSIQRLWRENCTVARRAWGDLNQNSLYHLRLLTTKYLISVEAGHLRLLEGQWYVTHTGLLHVATLNRCYGIRTILQGAHSDPAQKRWVFRATVYKSRYSRGFVGYGDAEPSNTSPLVRGAEMRIAETRAVNRALRKAYGIGLCSVEELGWSANSSDPRRSKPTTPVPPDGNGQQKSQPRLRDRLCVLIRHYNLDPTLVKAYAAHFCGTETIKEASRDLVESFISHLANSAKEDRAGLVCKLNSFAPPVEVQQ